MGKNHSGKIGNGSSSVNNSVPTAVVTSGTPLESRRVKQAIMATAASYILTTDNILLMMGINAQHQAATGIVGGGNRVVPTQIVTAGTPLAGKTIVELAADGHHALALTDDGGVYSWGWNNHGQVGIGTLGPTTCASGPMEGGNYCSRVIRQVNTSGTPMAGRVIRQIAAGDRWSYAVATDGTAYAWGDNQSGQLAVGSTAAYEPSPGGCCSHRS